MTSATGAGRTSITYSILAAAGTGPLAHPQLFRVLGRINSCPGYRSKEDKIDEFGRSTSEMLVSDPQWRACGRGKTIEVAHGLESFSATPTGYFQKGGCDTCRRAGSWPATHTRISHKSQTVCFVDSLCIQQRRGACHEGPHQRQGDCNCPGYSLREGRRSALSGGYCTCHTHSPPAGWHDGQTRRCELSAGLSCSLGLRLRLRN